MPRFRGVRAGGTTAVLTHAASGRHRAGPDDAPVLKSSHSGRKRWSAGVAISAVVVGTLGAFAPSASAAISSAGPTDAASLFPSYYADSNGLKLQLCQDGLPNCLAGPEEIQAVHARGGDAEAFYYHASADVAGFTIESALEAAYAGPGANQENTFQRRQATGKSVTPGGTYTITDPFGSYECTADGSGLVQPAKGCRLETTPVPGNFNAALAGPIGPFVTWDTFGAATGAPPAGYIGDNTTPHKVVGSPTGFNKMRIEGPGITTTCTNADGTTVARCDETDLLIVQGKVQPGGAVGSLSAGMLDYGDIPATPAATRTLTYSNVGDAPITINSATVTPATGTDAAAFAVTNNCPVAPATLDVGLRCTIDVTFTPEPGKASAATLTMNDDTPVGTRNVALKGSNLPKMYVSDPVPPLALAFGDQAANSTSAEINAVIGNSGTGPLTVASATITGTGAGHYKLGPNNTCSGAGVTVAPDGGCEIGVQFAPTTTGSKTANLRVTDANGIVVNVPLSGNAITSPLPGVPTQVTAAPGNGSATVNWIAPTNPGSSAITGYSVRVFQGTTQVGLTRTAAATAQSLAVTGLTNGTTYSFDVAAVNGSGTGSFSTPRATATPQAAVPGAPTGVTGTAGNAQVSVRWTAPTNDGGAPITGYTVRTFDAVSGAPVGTPVSVGNVTTATVTGLTNDKGYQFDVAATNSAGSGAFSARSATLTPIAPPADPVPTVQAQSPTAGATGVVVGADITATFSEAVQGVTTTTFALRPTATPTAAPIAGTVTRNGTTNQWILNPSASLANGTQYTATLTGGATAIRDSANQPLATTSWGFTTAPAADPVPTVTARTPAASATGVAVGADITATFSEAVQGVTTTTFALRPTATPTAAPIAGTVTRNGTTNQWILNPSASLANGTQYTATLTGGATAIRDSANQPLATTSWSFTTAAATNAAPTVTARTPGVNAVNVARNGNITITFSEGVQGVTASTIGLRNVATNGIFNGVVTQGTSNAQWIFNPNSTLPSSTQFRVTLTGGATGIRDLTGLSLSPNPVTWTFTTGTAL